MKGIAVANPLRRRNRALTAEQYTEVQSLVFDLVRDRLVEAFGPTGMWTVTMKSSDDLDAVFSETVAESLAWEVAGQLAPPAKSRHQAEPGNPVKQMPERMPEQIPEPEAVIEPAEEQLVA